MIPYNDNAGGQRRAEGPKVVCAWCGDVIRDAASKSAKRMCQPCFARMMREHCRAHSSRSPLSRASER